MSNAGNFIDNMYTTEKAQADIRKILDKLFRGDFSTVVELENELQRVARKSAKSSNIDDTGMANIFETMEECKKKFEEKMKAYDDKLTGAIGVMNAGPELFAEFNTRQTNIAASKTTLGI